MESFNAAELFNMDFFKITSIEEELAGLIECTGTIIPVHTSIEEYTKNRREMKVSPMESISYNLKAEDVSLNTLIMENSGPYVGNEGCYDTLKYGVEQYNHISTRKDYGIGDRSAKMITKECKFDFSCTEPRQLGYTSDAPSFNVSTEFSVHAQRTLESADANVKNLGRLLGIETSMWRGDDETKAYNEASIRYLARTASAAIGQSNYAERVWNGWNMFMHSLLVSEYGMHSPFLGEAKNAHFQMLKNTSVTKLSELLQDDKNEFLYVGSEDNPEYIAFCTMMVWGPDCLGFVGGTRSVYTGYTNGRDMSKIILIGDKDGAVDLDINLYRKLFSNPNKMWGYLYNYCNLMGLMSLLMSMSVVGSVAPHVPGTMMAVPFSTPNCKADLFPLLLKNSEYGTMVCAPTSGVQVSVAACNLINKFMFLYISYVYDEIKTFSSRSGKDIDVYHAYEITKENRMLAIRGISSKIIGASSGILAQIDVLRYIDDNRFSVWAETYMNKQYLVTELKMHIQEELNKMISCGLDYDLSGARYSMSQTNRAGCYYTLAYVGGNESLIFKSVMTDEMVRAKWAADTVEVDTSGSLQAELQLYIPIRRSRPTVPPVEVDERKSSQIYSRLRDYGDTGKKTVDVKKVSAGVGPSVRVVEANAGPRPSEEKWGLGSIKKKVVIEEPQVEEVQVKPDVEADDLMKSYGFSINEGVKVGRTVNGEVWAPLNDANAARLITIANAIVRMPVDKHDVVSAGTVGEDGVWKLGKRKINLRKRKVVIELEEYGITEQAGVINYRGSEYFIQPKEEFKEKVKDALTGYIKDEKLWEERTSSDLGFLSKTASGRSASGIGLLVEGVKAGTGDVENLRDALDRKRKMREFALGKLAIGWGDLKQ